MKVREWIKLPEGDGWAQVREGLVAEGLPGPTPHCAVAAARFRSPSAVLALLVLALAAFVLAAFAPAPAGAQTFTISASGNCGGTASNCGTPANRNGDRDTTWPGLQVDEGDEFTFTVQANHVPTGTTGVWTANLALSGSAWNSTDLRTTLGTPPSTPAAFAISAIFPNTNRPSTYVVASDGSVEGDESITISITSIGAPSSGKIGTPSSVTVTIRGTDSAPTFGSGAVPAKTFTAGTAITEFQVPAATGGNGGLTYTASGLPAGLRFDATGTDSPGCPGTEPREVCGTPTNPTTGAATVTITATDADGDRAALTFSLEVAADARPTFGAARVPAQRYVQGTETEPLTLPAATGGNPPLTYTLSPALPDGLAWTPPTDGTTGGTIAGRPAAVQGPVRYTLHARDADGDTAALRFSLEVVDRLQARMEGVHQAILPELSRAMTAGSVEAVAGRIGRALMRW